MEQEGASGAVCVAADLKEPLTKDILLLNHCEEDAQGSAICFSFNEVSYSA